MEIAKPTETARLLIRSYDYSDRDFVLSLWGDRDNGKYMSDTLAENMDENLASVAPLGKPGFAQDRKTRYKKRGEEKNFNEHFYKLDLRISA